MDRITAIHLFIRVVETGSFSKASADLGMTQPTATKHVAALKARLGARLFHRSTRGATPTEVGAAYYDKCKVIARELEEADNLAALMQQRVQGSLRISTSVAFGRRVLTPLVLKFMQQLSVSLQAVTFDPSIGTTDPFIVSPAFGLARVRPGRDRSLALPGA